MSLKNLNGRELVKAFQKLGYAKDHETGSHQIMKNDAGKTLSVPKHNPVKEGTTNGLIADFAEQNNLSVSDAKKQISDSL